MAAAEPGPRRGEARIELEALLVEVARRGDAVVGARQLVGAQVQLVGARDRPAGPAPAAALPASGSDERLGDAPGDVVLQPEQIAERRLHGVRREQRAARRLDELRRRAQLIAGAQQRAHHHAIDVGFGGERLEVGRAGGEARRDRARSHDQRRCCRTATWRSRRAG